MAAIRLRIEKLFQSTLSMRRATWLYSKRAIVVYFISIHALHEESDDTIYHNRVAYPDFNPRSP